MHDCALIPSKKFSAFKKAKKQKIVNIIVIEIIVKSIPNVHGIQIINVKNALKIVYKVAEEVVAEEVMTEEVVAKDIEIIMKVLKLVAELKILLP